MNGVTTLLSHACFHSRLPVATVSSNRPAFGWYRTWSGLCVVDSGMGRTVRWTLLLRTHLFLLNFDSYFSRRSEVLPSTYFYLLQGFNLLCDQLV